MTAATARFACAACGKKQPAAKMTYSRHTKNHYCLDFAACDRRRKKNARLGWAAATKGSRIPVSEGPSPAFVDVVAALPSRGVSGFLLPGHDAAAELENA